MLIGVTMGDPAGVGPEILLKAWRRGVLGSDVLVLGDAGILERCARVTRQPVKLNTIADPGPGKKGYLNVLDTGTLDLREFRPGRLSRSAGRASLGYLKRAIRLAQDGSIDAIVTLPVNKEAVQLSAPGFTGHTEVLAEMCGSSRYTMMLYSSRFCVSHVSTHVSMRQAVGLVRKARVLDVIRMTADALVRIMKRPRLAVAGLNPHAGENGLFGNEEIREIRPAVQAARREGISVEGPVPPDTVFHKAYHGIYDAVVCMYHDQGHIPLKMLAFDSGVNVTLGLPLVRTSVDHGTAFDIAWKGKASIGSFVEAYRLAKRLVKKDYAGSVRS